MIGNASSELGQQRTPTSLRLGVSRKRVGKRRERSERQSWSGKVTEGLRFGVGVTRKCRFCVKVLKPGKIEIAKG